MLPSLCFSNEFKSVGTFKCSYYVDSANHIDEVYNWLKGYIVGSRGDDVNLKNWISFKNTHYEICNSLDVTIKQAADAAYMVEFRK